LIDNQTRSLITSCSLSNTPYKFEPYDILKGETKNAKFLAINPTGSIPFIEDGDYRVFGGNMGIYGYICKSKKNIGNKFLPEEN
jgi:glutathione S-transferase